MVDVFRVWPGLIMIVAILLSSGTAHATDDEGPLDENVEEALEVCDAECMVLKLNGEDPEELEFIAEIESSPPCTFTRQDREHPDHGSTEAYKADCSGSSGNLVPGGASTASRTSCGPPTTANLATPVWTTFYYDDGISLDYAQDAADWTIKYMKGKFNGDWFKHAYKPDVNWCLRHVLPIPSYVAGGDVSTEAELKELRDYEARYWDQGQVTFVIGDGKITVNGEKRWGFSGPVSSRMGDQNDLPAVWVEYPNLGYLAASRLAIHEVGHGYTLDHSNCRTGYWPADHEWLHFMSWSRSNTDCWDSYPTDPNDRSGWHLHWSFKGPDAGKIDAEHYEWCKDYNSGSC